jgi:hypothetical protein
MRRFVQPDTAYSAVSRLRGQQLKERAQLDGWVRDGSAEGIAVLCFFGV